MSVHTATRPKPRRTRGRRIAHALAWAGLVAVVLMLIGVDIGDWLSRLRRPVVRERPHPDGPRALPP